MHSAIIEAIDSQHRYRSHLADVILAFWMEHGPDTRNGGFFGALDRRGHPSRSSAKGLVQHARFLWSFSAAYRLDPQPVYRQMAERAFSFLRERFYDRARLGWYYLVSAEGLPLSRQKHLYGQSFVIYGLSEYFLASGSEDALELALETFRVIDKAGHDSRWRGYGESFSEEWAPMPQHPDYGTDGDRKTLNTHLHLLESLTNLYRASKDATVKCRIGELMDLCANTMIDTRRQCAFQFFERDWTPLPSPASYGHDIELSWLLTEGVDVGEVSNAPSIHQVSLSLARGVAGNGLDPQKGGVRYESDVGGERSRELQRAWVHVLPAFARRWLDHGHRREWRVWWVQAEALVGFLNAYALSGDESFMEAFSNVQEWVCARQVDRAYGEWHQVITPRGKHKGRKGSLWKTPYHTTRACIELIQRLDCLRR